jgi:DNA-binding NarL/FixJ family response regulator
MPQMCIALWVPDRIIRVGIKSLIADDRAGVYDVVVCKDVDALLQQSEPCDILLVDVSGLSVSKVEECLKCLTKTRQVIAVSSRLSAVCIHRTMQLGVKGLLCRDELSDWLLTSLDIVQRGTVALSPQVTHHLLVNSNCLQVLKQLSRQDMCVLRLTAKGLTVKAIAAELGISARSVYRRHEKLRDMLAVSTNEGLIAVIREQGLLDLEGDECWLKTD